MSNELLAIAVTLLIVAVGGAIANTVRVTRLQTQVEPMWKDWCAAHNKNCKDGKDNK